MTQDHDCDISRRCLNAARSLLYCVFKSDESVRCVMWVKEEKEEEEEEARAEWTTVSFDRSKRTHTGTVLLLYR